MLVIEPRVRPVGSGQVRRLLPFARRRMVGPFIFCDVIGPDELAPGVGMDIDAHPHIGLSTLTYLTAGRVLHRDSTGAVQVIEPGGVNWMTAGRGVTHTERSVEEDRSRTLTMAGVQCWVALPDDAEDGPAFFEHADAAAIPTVEDHGVSISLAVGTGWGEASPVPGSSPLVFADAVLADGTLRIDDDHPERAVLVLDGEVRLDDAIVPEGHLAVLDAGATPTLTGRGRVIVLGGEPVGQRHIWWNFVHSDLDAVEAAKSLWRDQGFPKVPGDHDVYVPLPE